MSFPVAPDRQLLAADASNTEVSGKVATWLTRRRILPFLGATAIALVGVACGLLLLADGQLHMLQGAFGVGSKVQGAAAGTFTQITNIAKNISSDSQVAVLPVAGAAVAGGGFAAGIGHPRGLRFAGGGLFAGFITLMAPTVVK